MTWTPAADPRCRELVGDAIELVVEGRSHELGGVSIRRTLPVRERRRLGPFVFLDHMGPVDLEPGRGIDVPPHPHIGLATVTYLLEGELLHRDSLGTTQTIRPGDLNWMSAGRGIVHSERTPPELRAAGSRLEGLQSWVALPVALEESAPSFQHHPGRTLPVVQLEGAEVCVIAGTAYGKASPVVVASPVLYADARLDPGGELRLPDEHAERGLHVVRGEVETDGGCFAAGTLVVFRTGAVASVRAPRGARVLLLGGAPFDGDRHLFWNFVSSSRERLEVAKRDWREDRFARVPGEGDERVPLP